jgi:hypothetical protein
VVALAALMVGTVSTGCGSTCDTSGQAPVAYKDGLNPSPTTYESTDPQAAWLHFPPGRRYRLYHGLGTDQLMVDTDLGFEEHPLHPDGAVGNSSPAAGNAVIIEAKTPEYVQLRNDTCAEYWLWVGIRSLEGPSAKDAGTD